MNARRTAVDVEPKRNDTATVAEIVKQLKRGRGGYWFNDPRPRDRTVPLADYVKREVQRSLARVRLLSDYKPPYTVPKRTLADYRKAAKALREIAFTEEQREAAFQLEAVEQEPPERSNTLKHHCAAEAYFLMEMFSTKAPTGYETGAFRTIAALIYEAVSGEDQANLERACKSVLHSRRRFQHRFS